MDSESSRSSPIGYGIVSSDVLPCCPAGTCDPSPDAGGVGVITAGGRLDDDGVVMSVVLSSICRVSDFLSGLQSGRQSWCLLS